MYKIAFILLFTTLLIGCYSNSTSQSVIKPQKVYRLNIQEPSGITFYNNNLYIVSDYNGMVYKTDLNGKIIAKIQTPTTDNEGVCFNKNGNLVVVNETKRKMVEVNFLGEELNKFKIKGKQKHKNSGLEGICFYTSENDYFIVNEKSPKQLLRVSATGNIKEEISLKFSDDLSGICFDENTNSLWIVSDESQLLMNISLKGKLIKNYRIPVLKAEGVIIVKNKIFVVSDAEEKLYVFDKK
jgi:uncharacterized protein YjiK